MNTVLLKKISLALILVLLSGLVGYKLGTNEVTSRWAKFTPNVSVTNKLPPDSKPVDFSLFWKVWDEVGNKYVDKSKLDSQKMVYGAISGMVAAIGDPYTIFLPPVKNKEAKEDLNGSFEGIGAQLGIKDNRIVVISPLVDSPAEKAGIKTGDWIAKVDGAETVSWTLPETVAKIRGPKGTTVNLSVLHPKDDQVTEIKIVRDTIVLHSVEWKIVSSTTSANLKNAIYLRLSRFGDKTDPQWDKVTSEISNFLATSSGKIAGVILDVRNNPGGFLEGAVYTASEFLPASTRGEPEGVVVKQQSYTGHTQTYSVSHKGKLLDVPLVVLVNQGSASASEILAGSLKVAGRAKIIGMQSFGKGSVQQASDLSDGSGLHITTDKWLLANDFWVGGRGLEPDVKIENDPKDPTVDLQLDKAIETLNNHE